MHVFVYVIIYYEQNIGAFYRTFFSTRIKSTQQWPTPRAGLDRHVGPYCQVFDSMCENVLSFVCCFYSQHGESKRFILFYNDVTISTTNHSEIIVLLLYGLRCRWKNVVGKLCERTHCMASYLLWCFIIMVDCYFNVQYYYCYYFSIIIIW